jgi:hypothetical protein
VGGELRNIDAEIKNKVSFDTGVGQEEVSSELR